MYKVTNEYRIVSSSVASIYDKPTFDSELTTQALFWESLEIYDKKDNWYKIKLKDGYTGWIHSFYTLDSSVYDNHKLLQDSENWYWVTGKFLSLPLSRNSEVLVSFGSLIPCFNENNFFFTILPNSQKIGINKKKLSRFTDYRDYKESVIEFSSQLIGVPYLWGGKSSLGFDCSGLVQSIVNVCTNHTIPERSFLPRDTSKQVLSDILIRNKENPIPGDIIFFQSNNNVDHVGIYINDTDFIHSSGFVKVNSVDKKSKYYSRELDRKIYGIYRIK